MLNMLFSGDLYIIMEGCSTGDQDGEKKTVWERAYHRSFKYIEIYIHMVS